MAEQTAIEWCDRTFSPWEGCQKVGPGCDHCYAETRNNRFGGGNWGPGAPRRRMSASYWKQPAKWDREAAATGKRTSVFPSLCDPFDNAVDPQWRLDFADVIRATPNLDWLLLTKRIGNAVDLLNAMFPEGVPENVQIGATIVNQAEWDRDCGKIADVFRLTQRKLFLSMEPLLGGVDLYARDPFWNLYIGWVIVGGESGPGARPMHPDWARSLRNQCAGMGVPFLLKQWGEWKPFLGYKDGVSRYADASGSYGPERIYCFGDGKHAVRVGKKAAGRLLDGVQHDGFPA